MSAVVCALVSSSAQLAETLRHEHLVVADPDDLAGTEAAVSGASHVVLVAEQRHEAAVRRVAAVLADAGRRVALALLPHGPAAVVLLARVAAHSGAGAGQMPALVGALAAGAWSGAWVPGVAGLDQPSPGLGQHVASVLPGGAGYVVTLGPSAPSVVPVKKPRPADGTNRATAVVTVGALPDGARRALLTSASATDAVVLDWLAVDSVGRFGHARAVEGVALATDARGAFAQLRVESEPCRECGLERYATVCPYCRVRPAAQLESVPGGQL